MCSTASIVDIKNNPIIRQQATDVFYSYEPSEWSLSMCTSMVTLLGKSQEKDLISDLYHRVLTIFPVNVFLNNAVLMAYVYAGSHDEAIDLYISMVKPIPRRVQPKKSDVNTMIANENADVNSDKITTSLNYIQPNNMSMLYFLEACINAQTSQLDSNRNSYIYSVIGFTEFLHWINNHNSNIDSYIEEIDFPVIQKLIELCHITKATSVNYNTDLIDRTIIPTTAIVGSSNSIENSQATVKSDKTISTNIVTTKKLSNVNWKSLKFEQLKLSSIKLLSEQELNHLSHDHILILKCNYLIEKAVVKYIEKKFLSFMHDKRNNFPYDILFNSAPILLAHGALRDNMWSAIMDNTSKYHINSNLKLKYKSIDELILICLERLRDPVNIQNITHSMISTSSSHNINNLNSWLVYPVYDVKWKDMLAYFEKIMFGYSENLKNETKIQLLATMIQTLLYYQQDHLIKSLLQRFIFVQYSNNNHHNNNNNETIDTNCFIQNSELSESSTNSSNEKVSLRRWNKKSVDFFFSCSTTDPPSLGSWI